MRRARFEAPLFEGHKGVTGVLVPFDPVEVWHAPPVRLAGRRHGWLVTGTANGARFDGYIGERWNRFFITLDAALRTAARVGVGDPVTMVVAPTATSRAYLAALEQSRVTTQPGKPRPDAVAFPGTESKSRKRSRPARRPVRRR
ncbi:MAG TPA: DUF1905 domain-containing protein [Myxococcaceae bacterium]|nr:DUF1905 domain-containing protein [Myxococcaceae bacterium]